MPKAKAKRPPKQSLRAVQARVNSAQKEITAVLHKHNVVITATKVKVFHEEEGRLIGGDPIALSTLVHMCGLPVNTRLMPWIQIAPGAVQSTNGK